MNEILTTLAELRLIWIWLAAYFAAKSILYRHPVHAVISVVIVICAAGFGSMGSVGSRAWPLIIGCATLGMPVVLWWHFMDLKRKAETQRDRVVKQSSESGSGAEFREALRSFPDGGVLVVNRTTRRIDECNTSFARKMGYFLASEVVGKSADEFTSHPSEHAAKVDAQTKNIEERSVTLRSSDGTEVPALLSVMMMSREHALVRIRWI